MESKGSEAEVINSECNRQKTRLTVRGRWVRSVWQIKVRNWFWETAFSVKLCLPFMTSTLHDDKCLLLFPLVEPATNQSRGM